MVWCGERAKSVPQRCAPTAERDRLHMERVDPLRPLDGRVSRAIGGGAMGFIPSREASATSSD